MAGGDFWNSRPIEVKSISAFGFPARINAIVGNAVTHITRPEGARFLAFQVINQGFWMRPGYHPGLTFADGDVTVGTDVIAIATHGFENGDGPYQLTTTGVLPAGLALVTDYYVRAVTAGTITLHTSQKGAKDNYGVVDITAAAGGGTHTIGAMASADPTATNTNGTEAIHTTSAAGKGGEVGRVISAATTITFRGDNVASNLVYTWIP